MVRRTTREGWGPLGNARCVGDVSCGETPALLRIHGRGPALQALSGKGRIGNVGVRVGRFPGRERGPAG
jgi:hypothetical protein